MPGATIAAQDGTPMTPSDQVDYVSGRTRLFGIVGHPIAQVRSPEMITAELVTRGHDAVLVPMHVLPDDFDSVLPQLMRVRNLGGLVFTIPFKVRACALADEIGAQAHTVGAINALARSGDGRWRGEIFDGLGCVEAFRRRGISFRDRHVMLVGAGGAGSAIAVAIGFEAPASLRIFDIDEERARLTAARVSLACPGVTAQASEPRIAGVDILLNASPAGMLDDAQLPFPLADIPRTTVVFDAVVKPERTPLLALAERCGCTIVRGREMMLGQIARMVDFFYSR
jgi:shikimate dehydrogenase